MSSAAEIINHISVLLGYNNGNNHESSEKLRILAEETPRLYFSQLFILIKENSNEQIRMFCVVSLKAKYGNGEEYLHADDLNMFKSQIFDILSNENNQIVRSTICELIGSVASHRKSPDSEELYSSSWREFLTKLMGLYRSEDNHKIIQALRITDAYLEKDGEMFITNIENLIAMLSKFLDMHGQPIILEFTIKVVSSLLNYAEESDEKKFKDLVIKMVKAPSYLIEKHQDEAVECIGELSNMADLNKKIFVPKAVECYEHIKGMIAKENLEDHIKKEYCNFLIELYGAAPKKLDKYLKDILNSMIELNIDSIQDADDAWKNPISEEEHDQEEIFQVLPLFDKLLGYSDPKTSLPIMKTILFNSLRKSWKYQYFALLSFPQIGEYLEDSNDIADMIEVIAGFLENENPKLRYGAFQFFGQMADDMGESFSKKLKNLMPKLLKCISDPVPRVASHCFNSLANILEDTEDKKMIKGLLKEHFESVLSIASEQSKSIVLRKGSVALLTTLAEESAEDFEEYFEKSAKTIYGLLTDPSNSIQIDFRGQCCEFLTILGYVSKDDRYIGISKSTIRIYGEMIKNEIQNDSNHPLVEYVATGLQRMIIFLGDRIQKEIETILPDLINFYSNIELNTNTDTESFNQIFELMSIICKHLEDSILTHSEAFLAKAWLYLEVLPTNEHLGGTVKSLLGIIAKNPEKFNHETYSALFVKIIKTLVDLLPGAVNEMGGTIKGMIETASALMNQTTVEYVVENVIKALADKENEIESGDNADEGEEEDEEQADGEDKDKWAEATTLVEILGQVFKTKPELSQNHMKLFIKEKIPKYYKMDGGIKTAIYILDDIIEVIDFSKLKEEEIKEISQLLIEQAKNESDEIRQAAVFGIGLFAKFSGKFFTPYAQDCFESLKQAIDAFNEETKNAVYAKDNAIAAVGRIIKHQKDNLENYNEIGSFWVDNLPIKKDKAEGKEQHELLLDIIINQNAKIIFGEDGEKMKHVLSIFASIINTNMSSKDVDNKIVAVLKMLVANPESSEKLIQAGMELEESKKLKLAKYFTG